MKLPALIPLSALIATGLLLSSSARADVANEPPSVEITSPNSGDSFDGPTATIDVVLDARDGDDGLNRVILRIDDQVVATDSEAPWSFEGIEVNEGMHTLVAVAVSNLDLSEYPSMPVDIVVFASGNDEADAGADAKAKGCAVSSDTRLGGGGGLILLGLLSLGLARRRREG